MVLICWYLYLVGRLSPKLILTVCISSNFTPSCKSRQTQTLLLARAAEKIKTTNILKSCREGGWESKTTTIKNWIKTCLVFLFVY